MQVGFLLALLGSGHGGVAVQAAELDQIRDRGYLIVGVKDNLRPLGFQDSQNQLQGFEIDIARQLATELIGDQAEVVLKPVLNQDRLNALLNGEVDLLVARMSITDARSRLVDFSRPYYIDGTAFVSRDAAIQSLRDLQQQTVAVLFGSDTIPAVRFLLPSVRLQGVESYQAAKELLESGQVAAFAADATVLTGWVQEHPDYHLISPLISAEALAVAMPKGRQYDELRREVNQAVERWLKTGWLRQRIAEWGLPIDGFPSFTDRIEPSIEPSNE
ncbi:MAG: transporter substrate-binding domain-containing protein [Elainella sp. C42_A2020_010]|nr:transporter substrate-binding domain-containing protein [Elainella sp. C42_A2020_010]